MRWLLILCWLPSLGWAGDRRIDLGTGVVFPGDGFSVFENPATLPKYQGPFFDSGFYLAQDVQVVGAISGDLTKTFGFGLGVQRQGSTFTFTPGIGFALGNTFFGVSTPVGPQSAFRTFQVGMQVGGKSVPGLAIVARRLPSLTHWSLGIGWGEESAIRGELNADLVFDNQFVIQSAVGSVGIALAASTDLSFLVRYEFTIIPNYVFSLSGLELGINYWVGSQTALYALYQGRYAEYLLGIKLRL
jgi:hypothetical protein